MDSWVYELARSLVGRMHSFKNQIMPTSSTGLIENQPLSQSDF